MRELATATQLLIAAGIVNVWILRFGRPTAVRPDGASNLKDEFARYGYPDWVRVGVGTVKLTLAALLVTGIWLPPLAAGAGIAMALLMPAAVVSHVRLGDPAIKSMPALALLVLSASVGWMNGLL